MPELPLLHVHCDAPIGSLHLNVHFEVTKPWTVLFGPSGSGKSSLLRLIAGLWNPKASSVRMGESDLASVPAHRRRVGLVAQQPALFPHKNVLENVRFGSENEPNGAEIARKCIDLFELSPLERSRVTEISGGERQRVALARALAAEPRLLLLDEVFTGMHREQRSELLQRVQAHCTRQRIPVLSVTHDVAEALSGSDEVLRLDGGRIVAQGCAADVLAAERAALLRALS